MARRISLIISCRGPRVWLWSPTNSWSHLHDVSPTDTAGRETNTSKNVVRWIALLDSVRSPPPRSREASARPCTGLSARRSYTNRSSFQKTASTNEWEWTYSAERLGAHRVPRDFSYKEKQQSSLVNACMGFFCCLCMCVAFLLMTITFAFRIW